MEPWPPVTPKSMAEVALRSSRRLFGTDSWPVLLLPRITLGLAFLRARLDLRLLALLDVLSKLLVSFTPVLRARRPRPRRVHDQAFAQPRFAI